MQYQGIVIKTMRMGAPGGWKWTLTVNGKEKSGSCRDREDAIRAAKRFIDNHLNRQKRMASGLSELVDLRRSNAAHAD